MYRILPDNLKQIIQSRLTPEDIIRQYTGANRNLIRCPFDDHNDRTPSFSFNEAGFKCFGCGRKGSGINFVIEKFNLTYLDACQKIMEDNNLASSNGHFNCINSNYVKKDFKPKKTTIRIKKEKWDQNNLAFWKQYGIDEKILDYFNVYPCSEVWKSSKQTGNLELYYKYVRSRPAYAFYFGKGKWKIYFPFSEPRFLTNANANTLQGYNQLPDTGKLLIITSSMKDVMILNKLGYSAVAPQSENTVPNFEYIWDRFERFLVFYDNDKQGLKSGYELSLLLNCKQTYIPIEYDEKDPSDFYKSYGNEKTEKLIKNLVYDNIRNYYSDCNRTVHCV